MSDEVEYQLARQIAQIALANQPFEGESGEMASAERRSSRREALSIPLRLDGGRRAHTRDICAAGAYVVMPAGSDIIKGMSFVLTLEAMRLRASVVARVTRIEPLIGAKGVAFRFQSMGISAV